MRSGGPRPGREHGAYPLRLCSACGFGIPANHWAQHRRRCLKKTICPTCRRDFPCKNMHCPEDKIPPVEVEASAAPTEKLLRKLRMKAKRRSDGKWSVTAPWLKDAVVADSWEDAYALAMRRTG